MTLKDDFSSLQDKAKNIQTSFAIEILRDNKLHCKRQFIINILLLLCLIASVSYNIYLLNDTNTITDTIEIQDVETIDNSHIKIGDDIWEKSQ